MPMIILAFTVCLSANPAHCEQRELAYSAYDVTILQCVYGSQHQLAKWAADHPKWTVKKHRCLSGDERELGA